MQDRLIEENKTLAIERSQLSDLLVNVQNMHHDLESSDKNDRRRLESQLKMLEGQTYLFLLLVLLDVPHCFFQSRLESPTVSRT